MSGAIRTTFAPCRCWSAGSARKRRCLTLPRSRSYLVEDGNDHPRLRNGENGGLLACHDPAAERRVLVAGALAFRLRRVVLGEAIHDENTLPTNCRLTIRVIPTNLRAIEHYTALFCERSDVVTIGKSFELMFDKCGYKILPRLA